MQLNARLTVNVIKFHKNTTYIPHKSSFHRILYENHNDNEAFGAIKNCPILKTHKTHNSYSFSFSFFRALIVCLYIICGMKMRGNTAALNTNQTCWKLHGINKKGGGGENHWQTLADGSRRRISPAKLL